MPSSPWLLQNPYSPASFSAFSPFLASKSHNIALGVVLVHTSPFFMFFHLQFMFIATSLIVAVPKARSTAEHHKSYRSNANDLNPASYTKSKCQSNRTPTRYKDKMGAGGSVAAVAIVAVVFVFVRFCAKATSCAHVYNARLNALACRINRGCLKTAR